MTRFIRGLWRAITAAKNATGNILFLFLLVVVVIAIFSSEGTAIPESAALIIDPTGTIVDQMTAVDPLNEFIAGYEDRKDAETLLRDILEAIDRASTDDRIKSLVLEVRHFDGASPSKLEEIGLAIDKFKASGKPVFSFAPNYSQGQYLIAAHADKVYLDARAYQMFSGVFLTGLSVYPTYFKSALTKLKINLHVFRAGLYKSAVEPFLRDDMSEAARQANAGWLGTIWDQYRGIIVAQRGITDESFTRYTNHYDELLAGIDNDAARLAVQEGLVDDIITIDAWHEEMQAIVGKSGKTFRQISFKHYLAATRPAIPNINPGSEKIAVITAVGAIYEGNQPAGEIGGESMAKLIRKARDDKQVKAVVIRIDSPGGSPSASEQIRSELELTQDSGKPVIVSMSGYAASGGYWIASTANKIFAASTTVTGSIGVWMVFPTFEDSITELGINSDGVGTTTLSNAFNSFEALNPAIQKILQLNVDGTYNKFLELVAKGREMSVDDVDRIAEGRVWAGKTAVELGLVDAIGNLDDAIKSAALLSGAEEFDVIYLEEELSTRDRFIKQLLNSGLRLVYRATGGVSENFQILGKVPEEITEILKMSRAPGIYLQCIYCKVN